jgi:signal transduction histidine kinase/CheY-like chemotaxis protein
LVFNSDFFALKRYLVWKELKESYKSRKWRDAYISELKAYLKNKKMFYRARFLDDKGLEKISLTYDSKTDQVEVIDTEKYYQDKHLRDYFKKAIKLKGDSFYISELNLNVEHGVIERPFKPVIRYASPIINANGKTKGVLVLNFDASYILKHIENVQTLDKSKTQEYFLLNADGYYLYNRDKTKMWSFQLDGDYNFKKDYPGLFEEFKDRDRVTFMKDGYIISAFKIYPDEINNPYRYWYLVTVVNDDVALSSLDKFMTVFSIILALVLLFGLLLINWYVSKVINPLSKVTTQLKALSRGEIKKEEIEYKSNDEIGQIVDSTSIVIDAIETTIMQANSVANGKFTSDIKLLSNNDRLGNAIKDMTTRLKEITLISEKISIGNYDVKVIARGGDDKLGLALSNMVEYLKRVTDVAESIANGMIDVKYQVKGDEDRLGMAMVQMIAYLKNILEQANSISSNDFSKMIQIKSKNDELGIALEKMTKLLKTNYIKNKEDIWFSDGVSEFSDRLTGINDVVVLSKEAITIASRYINAATGVVYKYDKEDETLHLVASYAFVVRKSSQNSFKVGEGIVGQVALERSPILLKNVNDEEFEVVSGTTQAKPKEVFTFPLMFENELYGVIELSSFEVFDDLKKGYLEKISTVFATYLHAANQNEKIKALLEESQRAYEELQRRSEELQESNSQMEEQQRQLTIQAREMKIKNDELQTAKEDIDAKAEELERSSKYKSEFLANMSHELRTPLNSIILLSKLLAQKSDALDEEDIKKAKVINSAGEDLLNLINDILDLSKIESGNMELIEDEIETSEVAEELSGLFGEVAKEKGLAFIIEDEYQDVFKADRTKLLQILKNLLSNAFKFTNKGDVRLHIEQKGDELEFSVIDSGIGIPQDKLKQIFEAFKQVDGSISRKYGGTGLGLSISKTFIELMGGRIDVESNEGSGATFKIYIPLEKTSSNKVTVEEIRDKVENIKQETKDIVENFMNVKEEDTSIIDEESFDKVDSALLDGKNVLVVDDDSKNVFVLSSILQEMGAETYTAMNGKEALETLEKEQIDIVLMDLMMPIMNGIDAIKKIREDSKFDDVPVLVVTARNSPEDKKMCLEAGADDFLTKPIEQKSLVSILLAWSKKV